MKVAVVHDWLVPVTGAERVLEQLLLCHPGADVYTTIDFFPEKDRALLHGSRVFTSFIQQLPRARTAYWNYIPLMPSAIERFDLSTYDVVVSNSHTIAKGARTVSRQLHLCYLETPMRFAWDLEEYYLERFRQHGPRRMMARAVFAWMRRWDARNAPYVDEYIALSQYVADRCRRAYGRTAQVLPPPVRTEFFTPDTGVAREGYLAASRLTPFKNIAVIVEGFRAMPERRLVVIGEGPEHARLRARCPSNVTLLGYQDDTVLRDHMRRARAFVFAAPEDFGIVMAEAQACGTPVIALGVGGAREIVRGAEAAHPTGIFFDDAAPESIVRAVNDFDARPAQFTPESCRANALRFTEERFRTGWMAHVERALEARRAAAS